MTIAKYYYECHITIDPVFDKQRDNAKSIAEIYGFKLADLVMLKTPNGEPIHSQKDTFMTGHSKIYEKILGQTRSLVAVLRASGFIVRRVKIEDTVMDTRIADIEKLLV